MIGLESVSVKNPTLDLNTQSISFGTFNKSAISASYIDGINILNVVDLVYAVQSPSIEFDGQEFKFPQNGIITFDVS